ncbi:uncharacterized protein BDR25DRAFT_347664 [Lindgomyces ingoldianus]|uniref:Uncharacterized protein n=1 Tax=Lindgomyces ingoldianus TaxID=673940 RepID=A0ACB6Q944_9PLEO|nr:uncharacterized protein BDR25DRAFT_347664 [Lindgomyces ingoldianus]KAF2462652.1 hypothetical protein BDR25DRAFT_347664 [Lindgomyces ingoldianus]
MNDTVKMLSKKEILATFDQLVSDGVIIYGPHEVIEHDCEGYPLEFRVCPSIANKPHKVGADLTSAFNMSRKWGPGSDMYCVDERLKLAKLNDSHYLVFNLFCVDKPQFVLLTLDSYRRQHEPMDQDDFEAALKVLTSLDDMYVIYNCTEAAGCSRVHKHMQGLQGPPRAFESFIHGEKTESKIPFRHFAHRFSEGFDATSASDLSAIYETFLGQAKQALGLSQTDDVCPHNVVLWRDWIIVVPRRSAAMGRASANAAGMLGSIWLPEKGLVDEWMRLGCSNVLKALGV